ncbi:hypothetical protein [Olsenella phocaeensis]|uniref:hypothetical protein n=1 Tax=Olsenella phocaeensis TaxID=1852385 RepID=UPI00092FFAE6|nr:hypothetical protein [Olsenella phocaeensis]
MLAYAVPSDAEGSDASAFFHPTITSSDESIANGQYVSFQVKYTLDHGKIKAGDYVLVTVPDSLKDVSLAVSPQVFADKVDLGGGRYKLVFNENAANGISGSFSISAFGNNSSDQSKDATISVGSASKTVTVGPANNGGGVGLETRGVVKWGYKEKSGEGFTQDTAVTGIYNQDEDVKVTFAVEADPRQSQMWAAVITDVLPPELVLDPDSFEIWTETVDSSGTRHTGEQLSAAEVAGIISVSGGTITMDFGDRLDGSKFYRVYYSVTVPRGTKARIANSAKIDYTGQNGPSTETSTFTLKPQSGYSSSIGYKSVDKAEVGADPADQVVTYTITFENDQGFAVGDINLDDRLDSRVRYLDSYGSD